MVTSGRDFANYLRGYRNAQIDDLQFKAFRTIPASEPAWPNTSGTRKTSASIQDSTEVFGTVALTVVHRDSCCSTDVGIDSRRRHDADQCLFHGEDLRLGHRHGCPPGTLSVEEPVSTYLPLGRAPDRT